MDTDRAIINKMPLDRIQYSEGIIYHGHTGLVLVYKRVNIKMLCHTLVRS